MNAESAGRTLADAAGDRSRRRGVRLQRRMDAAAHGRVRQRAEAGDGRLVGQPPRARWIRRHAGVLAVGAGHRGPPVDLPPPRAVPRRACRRCTRLRDAGHRIVILTAKPRWAIPDTLRWIADHELPTEEIHIRYRKYGVECDVYLDDSPIVLPDLVRHRPNAAICRMIRPWNDPVDGTDRHRRLAVVPGVRRVALTRPGRSPGGRRRQLC